MYFLNTLLFDYPCFNDFKTLLYWGCFRLPLSINFSLDWALMFWLMLLLSLQWNKSLCFFSNKTHNWFKVREEVVWDKLIVFATKFRQFDPVSLANQLLARFKFCKYGIMTDFNLFKVAIIRSDNSMNSFWFICILTHLTLA